MLCIKVHLFHHMQKQLKSYTKKKKNIPRKISNKSSQFPITVVTDLLYICTRHFTIPSIKSYMLKITHSYLYEYIALPLLPLSLTLSLYYEYRPIPYHPVLRNPFERNAINLINSLIKSTNTIQNRISNQKHYHSTP